MNRRMIITIVGVILLLEAGLLLFPTVVGFIYGEQAAWSYLYTAVGSALVGGAIRLFLKPKDKTIYAREGLVTVALCWVVLSLVGAIPFVLCGDIPSYLDAVFEMVSGFTTTGSSILPNVETLTHASLFWRSFSHWIGGMGVLVFMLGIVNLEGGQAIHLLRAESPGPSVTKMVPRMTDSSQILYAIYLVLTVIQVIFYLIGGMPLFDSLCNAFGTAGTGGFAIKAASLAAYDYYAQTVTTVFMILFGVNFSLYFLLLRKKFGAVWRNTELRWYLGIIFGSIALITINIAPTFSRLYDAFHHAAFAVASIITTTGYCTENFDLWPAFSRMILCFLIIVGAMAGSTGGGLKVSRVALLCKSMSREVRALVRPRSVKTVTMDGKRVEPDALQAVSRYFILYVLLTMLSLLLVSLDNFDLTTTVTAVLTTFNNVGPGLEMVGPVGNFAAFSPLSKIVMILGMLFGRLEIYPMLLLMLPSTWAKR